MSLRVCYNTVDCLYSSVLDAFLADGKGILPGIFVYLT